MTILWVVIVAALMVNAHHTAAQEKQQGVTAILETEITATLETELTATFETAVTPSNRPADSGHCDLELMHTLCNYGRNLLNIHYYSSIGSNEPEFKAEFNKQAASYPVGSKFVNSTCNSLAALENKDPTAEKKNEPGVTATPETGVTASNEPAASYPADLKLIHDLCFDCAKSFYSSKKRCNTAASLSDKEALPVSWKTIRAICVYYWKTMRNEHLTLINNNEPKVAVTPETKDTVCNKSAVSSPAGWKIPYDLFIYCAVLFLGFFITLIYYKKRCGKKSCMSACMRKGQYEISSVSLDHAPIALDVKIE